jgi:chromosome segregation ATPase
MLAIAVQMLFSLALAFVIGYYVAWLVRGMRERNKFERFFSDWRERYTGLERDLDRRMAQLQSAQKELAQAKEVVAAREAAFASSQSLVQDLSMQLEERALRLRGLESEKEALAAKLLAYEDEAALGVVGIRRQRS